MIITKIKIYLVVGDQQMTGAAMSLAALFKWPTALHKLPYIKNFLFLPQLENVVFIVSDLSTGQLGAALRSNFPQRVFVVTPINEIDGLLPQAVWDFINSPVVLNQ